MYQTKFILALLTIVVAIGDAHHRPGYQRPTMLFRTTTLPYFFDPNCRGWFFWDLIISYIFLIG